MIPYKLNPLGNDISIPLTFSAAEPNSTIKLAKTGSPDVSGLYYRTTTESTWIPYTINTIITLVNVDDYVQFKNTLNTLNAYR